MAPDRPADLARLTGCSSWWDPVVCRNGGSGKGKLSYWESILTIFQKLVHQKFWNCWLDCWKKQPRSDKNHASGAASLCETPSSLFYWCFSSNVNWNHHRACRLSILMGRSVPEKKQVSNFASQFVYIQKMKLTWRFQKLIQIRKVHQTFPHFATSESTHRNGNTQGPNQVEDATDMGRPEDCGWCGWLFLKWMHPKQPWNLNTYKWCDYNEITWYSNIFTYFMYIQHKFNINHPSLLCLKNLWTNLLSANEHILYDLYVWGSCLVCLLFVKWHKMGF